MKEEEINKLIAEVCGWVPRVHSFKIAESETAIPRAINFISAFEAQEYLDRARRNTEDYERKLSVFPAWEPCPDYCADLNAMHEAEKVLPYIKLCNYLDRLINISFEAALTPARQRAEAFLKTLEKWEESE